jgi:hypothetical protein
MEITPESTGPIPVTSELPVTTETQMNRTRNLGMTGKSREAEPNATEASAAFNMTKIGP